METTKAARGFGTSYLSHFVFCNHICLVRMISSMWVLFAPNCRSLPPTDHLQPFTICMCINVHILSHVSFVLCLISSFICQCASSAAELCWRRSAFFVLVSITSPQRLSATIDDDKLTRCQHKHPVITFIYFTPSVFFSCNFPFLCYDITVLMLWLGLGKKKIIFSD